MCIRIIFSPLLGAGSTRRRHRAGFRLAALLWRASGASATWSPLELGPQTGYSSRNRGRANGLHIRAYVCHSSGHMAANPRVEHVKTPRTRPVRLTDDEILPDAAHGAQIHALH